MLAAMEDVIELGNRIAAFDTDGHACCYMMVGKEQEVCCWGCADCSVGCRVVVCEGRRRWLR